MSSCQRAICLLLTVNIPLCLPWNFSGGFGKKSFLFFMEMAIMNAECGFIRRFMDQRYAQGLRDCGVVLLENQSISFEKKGLKMQIYGFELDKRYYQKFHQDQFCIKELTETLGTPEPECYNILLAHNPVYFDDYATWGADLTVSGHLHGGIVRIPGIGGVISPQARLFPRYDAGHFKKDGKDLVVSRGLGTHTVNIRIFNPAELSVIHLHPKEI